MTWLVVVLFANVAGDVYIFTNPTFETRDECMATLHNPENIAGYTAKLVEEYGRTIPIKAVNCLEKDEIKRILDDYYNSKESSWEGTA